MLKKEREYRKLYEATIKRCQKVEKQASDISLRILVQTQLVLNEVIFVGLGTKLFYNCLFVLLI